MTFIAIIIFLLVLVAIAMIFEGFMLGRKRKKLTNIRKEKKKNNK